MPFLQVKRSISCFMVSSLGPLSCAGKGKFVLEASKANLRSVSYKIFDYPQLPQ